MKEYLSNGRLWRLCQKELRESLRDRRTIVTLVLMPILVYPLLSMALQRLLIGGLSKSSQTTAYVVGAENDEAAVKIRSLLLDTQRINELGIVSPIQIIRRDSNRHKEAEATPSANQQDEEVAEPTDPEAPPAPATTKENSDHVGFDIVVVEGISLAAALQSGQIELAVSQVDIENIDLGRGQAASYQMALQFREGDLRSESALSEMRRAMQLMNDYQFELARKRIDRRLPPLIQVSATGIGERADPVASIAGVIPLVLILMTITGAVYPAIDLTAGERERGTMESLIASPAPRFALLLSKYVAVVCVAILTALANLFATCLTLSFGGLGQALLGKNGFSIWMLLQILPLLAIFASFFSAILLALCSFARSFKEAQAYLIPVMLLSLGPGLVTLMPNVKFTTMLGIVPLVNILLLSRDIMTGQSSLVPAFAAVFSTIIYACATLVVASRLFGADAATSGSQETWAELLGRPKKERMVPDLGELAIYLALLFPVFFVASNAFVKLELKGASAMFVNAILLALLFMILPLVYCWYRRIRISRTFQLISSADPRISRSKRMLKRAGYVAAVLLLSGGLWMIAFESYLLLESWSLASQLSEADRTQLKETFLKIPFWVVILTGALAPAVFEEFFFRGFVLSAFRSKLTPFRSVLYTAILFGVFHVISGNILSLEKFFPTTILGVALGVVAVRTGSIWPGILLHALHNSLVFGMSRVGEIELAKWFGTNTQHIPVAWLIAGGASIAFGIAVLFLASQHQQSTYEDLA